MYVCEVYICICGVHALHHTRHIPSLFQCKVIKHRRSHVLTRYESTYQLLSKIDKHCHRMWHYHYWFIFIGCRFRIWHFDTMTTSCTGLSNKFEYTSNTRPNFNRQESIQHETNAFWARIWMLFIISLEFLDMYFIIKAETWKLMQFNNVWLKLFESSGRIVHFMLFNGFNPLKSNLLYYLICISLEIESLWRWWRNSKSVTSVIKKGLSMAFA